MSDYHENDSITGRGAAEDSADGRFMAAWALAGSFAFAMSLAMALLYAALRSGLDIHGTIMLLSLSISALVFFFPFALPRRMQAYFENNPALLGVTAVVVFLSPLLLMFFGSVGLYVLAGLAVFSLVRAGRHILRLGGRSHLLIFFAAPLLALFLFGESVFRGDIYAVEMASLGVLFTDNPYHTAIANMFAEYGAVTIGVDGMSPYSYHMGMNLWLGAVARIAGGETMATTVLCGIVVFIPFLVFSILISSLLLGRTDTDAPIRDGTLRIGLLVSVMVLGKNFFMIHGNYLFSLSLWLLLLPALPAWMQRRKHNLRSDMAALTFALVGAGLLAVAMISTGYIWTVVCGYCLLRTRGFSARTLAAVGLGAAFVVGSVAAVRYEYFILLGGKISWLSFVRDADNLYNFLIFLVPVMVFCYVSLTENEVRTLGGMRPAVRERRIVDVELIVVLMIAAILPGAVFDLGGGNDENALMFTGSVTLTAIVLFRGRSMIEWLRRALALAAPGPGAVALWAVAALVFLPFPNGVLSRLYVPITDAAQVVRLVGGTDQATPLTGREFYLRNLRAERRLFSAAFVDRLNKAPGMQIRNFVRAALAGRDGVTAVFAPKENVSFHEFAKIGSPKSCPSRIFFWPAFVGFPSLMGMPPECHEADYFLPTGIGWDETGGLSSQEICRYARRREIGKVFVFRGLDTDSNNEILQCVDNK